MERGRGPALKPLPLALGALGALALAAAACTNAQTAETTTTSTTPESSTSSTSSSTTSSTAAGLAHCQPAGLAATVAGTQGAAGTIEVTLALRDVGPASCALEGYPGLQLLDSAGNQLPTSVIRGGSYQFTNFAASPVVLAAGQSAYVNLGYSDVASGPGDCSNASSMWVTPPDDVSHLTMSVMADVCGGGKITVSPVFSSSSPETKTTAAT